MPELLLEVLSEEIPARMQSRAAVELRRLVTEGLREAGLEHGAAESFATPRRLALVVRDLPKRQPDVTQEKRGPREGAPEQALQGFLKANGLGSLEEAELRETDKGKVYFAVREIPGRPAAEVLPEVIGAALRGLTWPKSMRWSAGPFRWVRPLHALLAVFDGKRLKGEVGLGEASFEFTNRTVGHRFLAPKAFAVKDFKDYKAKLKAAKVLLDPAERKAVIAKKGEQLAGKQGLGVTEDPGLLDEVAGLVEWPLPLLGRIDPEFMDLPPEVLTTSLRSHQKYFVTQDQKGRLADRFLVVANMVTADRGKAIVAGNERVLRARLSDARFFWDQDRKASLASRAPALAQIVFHAKLGTLDQKVDRVQALAVEIARHVTGADPDRVRSAARLAKADLTSGMVGEFPELQGIMGRYYARHDGEHDEVAEAIAEHYAPQGPNDACPSAPVSVCVALADKIDSLVGFFAIDEKPTGSKDPYALRRAALGVIRLIVENNVRVPLLRLFDFSFNLFPASLRDPSVFAAAAKIGKRRQEGSTEAGTYLGRVLLAFIADRVKVALREKGVRHDLIDAVLYVGEEGDFVRSDEDDLVRLLARVEALEGFLGSDDGANLLVAYRRAANIVRIEQKKDKTVYNDGVAAEALAQSEEQGLYAALNQVSETAGGALSREDFTGAMAALAGLRAPVDAFFDKVTVNADDADLRVNRLRLLSAIGGTLGQVADFSKIEG